MYPSLYPISLIFSRLLPSSSKGVRISQENNDENRVVSYKDLEDFLLKLLSCANNKNYLGRLMLAKAISPFIPFSNLTTQILTLLNQPILKSKIHTVKNHNFSHGVLMQIHQLLNNYFELSIEFLTEDVI